MYEDDSGSSSSTDKGLKFLLYIGGAFATFLITFPDRFNVKVMDLVSQNALPAFIVSIKRGSSSFLISGGSMGVVVMAFLCFSIKASRVMHLKSRRQGK